LAQNLTCRARKAGAEIRLNCPADSETIKAIRPGRILTERYEKLLGSDELWWSHYSQTQLLKRHGRSVDIANAAVFLASEDSSFITGIMLDVNGRAIIKL